MNDRQAFISGIKLFCKSAGFDDEDAEYVEHVLFMPPEDAAPIIKNAQLSVKRIDYFRAGQLLEKKAELPPEILQAIEGGDFDRVIQWAQKQKQGGGKQQGGQQGWIGRGVENIMSSIGNMFTGSKPGKTPPGGANAAAGAVESETPQFEKDWEREYEASPYKAQGMPRTMYMSLRGDYDSRMKGGGAIVPMSTFIGNQWAAHKYGAQRRFSRNTMRGFGLDMDPGQLAGLTDQQIASRTSDPIMQDALRNARDLAAEREKLHGGVDARMGTGMSTGAAATSAARQTAPPAAATKPQQTSSSPPADVPQEPIPPLTASGSPGAATAPAAAASGSDTATAATAAAASTPKPWTASGSFGGVKGTATGGGGAKTTTKIEPDL